MISDDHVDPTVKSDHELGGSKSKNNSVEIPLPSLKVHIKKLLSFGVKIWSDICPLTISFPRSEQFSNGIA